MDLCDSKKHSMQAVAISHIAKVSSCSAMDPRGTKKQSMQTVAISHMQ